MPNMARLTQLIEDSSARAKTLALSGAIAAWQGDYARGVPLLEQGAALFEQLGETSQAVNALMNKGDVEQTSQVLAKGLAMGP